MKKATKSALFMSILSLILCVSMFLGTTFAWFTHSASNTANRIEAGSLDVKLLMDKLGDGNYADISDGSGDIFSETGNGINWEPGKTEIVYLAVKNAASLDLKYNIVLNITDNGIADSLEYAILDGAKAADLAGVTDWATLKQYAGAQVGEVASGTVVAAPNGQLLDTETDYFALAVHMKEKAGNVFQNKSVTIDVAVQATQLASETDSFGNQYDADAVYAAEVSTPEELQKALNIGGRIILTSDINAATAATRNMRFTIPEGRSVILDLNGHTLTSKDGGGSNTMAIYISRGANFTLNDSEGGGKIVASCYGVYVQPNASFTMNGGAIEVSGNGQFDIAVSVWNAEFIMNGGSIDAKYAVWASNYWKEHGETNANTCSITIADTCTVQSSDYADVEISDAPDTILNVPSNLVIYSGN